MIYDIIHTVYIDGRHHLHASFNYHHIKVCSFVLFAHAAQINHPLAAKSSSESHFSCCIIHNKNKFKFMGRKVTVVEADGPPNSNNGINSGVNLKYSFLLTGNPKQPIRNHCTAGWKVGTHLSCAPITACMCVVDYRMKLSLGSG